MHRLKQDRLQVVEQGVDADRSYRTLDRGRLNAPVIVSVPPVRETFDPA